MWRVTLASRPRCEQNGTHLLTLYPTRGAFSKNAIHCPDNRKQRVRKAWAIISGRTNWLLALSNGCEEISSGWRAWKDGCFKSSQYLKHTGTDFDRG
jgi:hypothetical protein